MTLPLRLSKGKLGGHLLLLAAIFLALYSLSLTLSPAARARTWGAGYRWAHWLGLIVWGVAFYITHRQTRHKLLHRDPLLLPLAALLSGWGLLTVWRLTIDFGLRQTIWLAISLAVFIAGLRLNSDLNLLRRYKYIWLTGGLLLTALTLFFGTNPSNFGPRLWLGCCGVYLQPSEPLKLLLIVFLAAYLADRQPLVSSALALFTPTALMTGVTLLLLLFQRDLGTATIFLFTYTAVIFTATGRRRVLLTSLEALIVAGLAGYWLFDLIRFRIEAWLNPWLDPSGRSYQIVQSLLAVANGGILGRGPGLGSPGMVPISHSDFIFTSIAEEAGLVGSLALLLIIALLTLRGLRATLHASSTYHRYLALGITTYFASQSILIIAGTIRLLPLTGVTLPFVSYGGSSLLTSFIALLLLMHISNHPAEGAAPLPKPRPILYIGAILLAGLAAAALVNGWWAFVRGPDLLTRTDNARLAIADRFVPRGALLDRRGRPLNATGGQPGEYARQYLHPESSPVLGYAHPTYGLSGLEASLDPILRGLQYQDPLALWLNHLLYGQPPPGRNVRLSLDLSLQAIAQDLLTGRTGAIVLLDASSGEVLVMASSPTFDPNYLDERWNTLLQDPDAPLVNRAAQGSYRPGTMLGPLLLAAAQTPAGLPPIPDNLPDSLSFGQLSCARSPQEPLTWESMVAAGCPAPLAELGLSLGGDTLLDLFQELGFYSPPLLRLPVSASSAPASIAVPQAAATGQGNLLLSPLQLALAAAALNNQGTLPPPQIAIAVDDAQSGWVSLPVLDEPRQVFTPQAATATITALATNASTWGSMGTALNDLEHPLTWHLGGTLPGQPGDPLVVVVLLEDHAPASAEFIAQVLLKKAAKP